MTKFLQPKFSVNVGGPDYSAGWERTFAPKPENGHGAGDEFGGEDFPSQPEQLTFKNVIEPYITYRPMYQTESVTVPASQAPGWALAEWKERIAASSKEVGKMLNEYRYGDQAPVDLDDYQKRQQAWTEHNFPVRVSADQLRVACEFFTREGLDVDHDTVENFAYLIASRERGSWQPLIGAVEELGELCHAHLKNAQGIRGTPEEWHAKKQDAIGDVLIYLLDYATKEGFSVQECLEKAWAEVSLRDWVRFPGDGRTK